MKLYCNRIVKSTKSALLMSVRAASRQPSQGTSPVKPLIAVAGALGVGYSYTRHNSLALGVTINVTNVSNNWPMMNGNQPFNPQQFNQQQPGGLKTLPV